MNVLFIHEVDWLSKVVFDMHSLAEALSLRGHRVYAIDHENAWSKRHPLDWGSLRTRQINGVARALPGAAVELRRPGYIKFPGLSRLSAGVTHHREIGRVLREEKIDAIVLYGVATNGLQSLSLAERHGVPLLFRSIDIAHQLVPYPLLRPLVRLLEKKVYAGADMVLTLTPKLSRYAAGMGAREERVKLLLMPVDTGIFHPGVDTSAVRRKWGLREDEKVVLFMGTLFDFSGLDEFLPRFAEISGQMPEARLLVVGDGPQRARLEKITGKPDLAGRVIITGFQPYQDMPQYINLASVCIHTFPVTGATRDIFPGKIVQYLACGRPVAATRLDGMTAVIAGEEQGVVYAGSPAGVADSLLPLLKSEALRRRLGQAGLGYVQQAHSHQEIARQLEERIEEAIARKKNPAR